MQTDKPIIVESMKTSNVASRVRALLVALVAVTLASCSDTSIKTLSQLKDDQAKAIARLISERNFTVVERSSNTLPATIDPNVYYLMPNGLYIRVHSVGTSGTIVKQNQSLVYVTFDGHQFSNETNPILSFASYSKPSVPPVEFRYTYYYNSGDVHFSTVALDAPQVGYDVLMCEGIAYPLSIVDETVSTAQAEALAKESAHVARLGNKALLSLIIPFEIGPSSTYSKGYTTFLENIEYTFR